MRERVQVGRSAVESKCFHGRARKAGVLGHPAATTIKRNEHAEVGAHIDLLGIIRIDHDRQCRNLWQRGAATADAGRPGDATVGGLQQVIHAECGNRRIGNVLVGRIPRHPRDQPEPLGRAAADDAAAQPGARVRCTQCRVVVVITTVRHADQHAISICRMGGDRGNRTRPAGTVDASRARPRSRLVDAAPDVPAAGPDLLTVTLVHGERRNEQEAGAGDSAICVGKIRATVGGLLQRIAGVLEEQHIVCRTYVVQGVDGDIAAITTGKNAPVGARRSTTLRAVVLQSAKIGQAIGIDCAVVELRGHKAIVAVDPACAAGDRCAADLRLRRIDCSTRVINALDATVATREHDLVRGAVVLRMEHDRMLIGVVVFHVGTLGKPPVAGGTPVHAGIVRTPKIDAARPDDVRIERINRDDVVVPALVRERRGGNSTFSQQSNDRIAQHQLVDFLRRAARGDVAVALGDPAAGITIAGRAVHRKQAILAGAEASRTLR